MKQPYTIVIAHQKGGVGKSTIATNLAVELAKKIQISVIDLDTQKSTSYFNSLRKKIINKNLILLILNLLKS